MKTVYYPGIGNTMHASTIASRTFKNLLESISGLLVLLSSQFQNESFAPGATSLTISDEGFYEGEFGLGDFFIVKYPNDWSEDEIYDFDWSELKNDPNRFQKIDYNAIKQKRKVILP